MNRTADLVVVGMTDAAAAAATDAARHGKHVLIVGDLQDARYSRGLRRSLDAAGAGCRERVSILAGFEVVSVDGIGTVEVVLIRNLRTGAPDWDQHGCDAGYDRTRTGRHRRVGPASG